MLLLPLLLACESPKAPALDTGDRAETGDSGDTDDTGDTSDSTDSDTSPDLDGDGVSMEEGDCDDLDSGVSPHAEEIVGDGVDQTCDGLDVAAEALSGFALSHTWTYLTVGLQLAAGDLDGDGYPELLVSASYDSIGNQRSSPPAEGFPYVSGVFAVHGPITGDDDLLGHPLFTQGPDDDIPWEGLPVAATGDMNEDGLGDFAFGIPQGHTDSHYAGAVYLIDGPGLEELDFEPPARCVFGSVEQGRLGTALEAPGDLDGDGVPDLLVTAPGYAGADGTLGALLRFSGPVGEDWTEANADAAWFGAEDTNLQGDRLAAGDWNGDGYTDAALGAPEGIDDDHRNGRAWVLYGPLAGGSLSDADAIVEGETVRGDFGRVVASASDADGDGANELLIGSPFSDFEGDYRDNTGAVWYFADPPVGLVSQSSADAVFLGLGAGDLLGYAVAPVGDRTDDGLPDLLVTAPQNYTGSFARVSLFASPFSGELLPQDAAWIGVSTEYQDRLGMALVADQDLTGDGVEDLVLSAPWDRQTGAGNGRVTVVY